MLTAQEITAVLVTPVTTDKYARKLQDVLLTSICEDRHLAATRALALLEDSDLRALYSSEYAKVTIPVASLALVAPVMETHRALVAHKDIIKMAVKGLSADMPQETIALLADYMHTSYPTTYVPTIVYVVLTFAMKE